MSRMSQLHVELSEQANELGFETIQDAMNSGYTVDYSKGKLVKRGLGYSEAVEYLAKEQEKAHEEWLKEKEHKLKTLRLTAELCRNSDMPNTADDLESIADFFEKGEV